MSARRQRKRDRRHPKPQDSSRDLSIGDKRARIEAEASEKIERKTGRSALRSVA